MTVYKWVIVSVCVLCGMLYVSDFVKAMQCNNFAICVWTYVESW